MVGSESRTIWPLLLLVLLHTGCSLFTTSPVPGYLPYVVADFDLDEALPDEIEEVEVAPLSTTNETYVALFVRSRNIQGSPDYLLLYDSSFNPRYSQSYGPSEDAPFNQSLVTSAIATVDGESEQLILGNIRFIPRTGNAQVTNGVTPAVSVFAGIQQGSSYYTVRQAAQTNSVVIEPYTSRFLLRESEIQQVQVSEDPSTLTGEVHGHVFRAEDDSSFVIVTAAQSDRRLLVISIPSSDLPNLDSPLATNYPTVTIRGTSPEYTFRIRQGIVTADTSKNLFRRYEPSSGTEIDSFVPGNPGQDFFDVFVPAFFADSGDYLLLDTAKRRLYEVAPWW